MTDNTNTVQSTEDIINSSLDSMLGTAANSETSDVSTEAQDPGTQTDDTQGREGQSAPGGDHTGSGRPGSAIDNRGQAQPNQDRQTTPQAQGPGRVRDDGKGNLVDAQGQLVAARGAERRWYNEAQAATRQARQVQTELAELRGKVQPYEQAFATFANLQMQPQEVAVGAQLYKSFRTNPRETIEYLIGEARKNGVTIDGAAPAVDIGAIRSTVLDALKPILDERAERTKAAEQDAAADREYEAFMSDPDFPNAHIHENEIAAVMRYNPRLSMREAYLKLEAESLRNGLDFSQPLKAQWDAKRANGAGTPAPSTGRTPSVPLPGGRASSSATKIGATRIAAPNTSNSDIVREALREVGIS